jgi:hypothetical protein
MQGSGVSAGGYFGVSQLRGLCPSVTRWRIRGRSPLGCLLQITMCPLSGLLMPDVCNQRNNAQSDQAADNSDDNANEQLRSAGSVTPWHKATMLLSSDNARQFVFHAGGDLQGASRGIFWSIEMVFRDEGNQMLFVML